MTIPPNVRYQDRFLKAYRQAREGIMGRTRMLVIIVSFSLLLCFTVSVERKDEKDFKNRFDYYHHFPIYIF
jgi:hypothetical protein